MELTVLLIPLFYSGPRQNHRLTANFDMFKLTIFIIVGHQRTVLHVVNVGYHADVRIGTKRALVHKKVFETAENLMHIGQNGRLLTNWVISGITTLTKFDS